MNTCILMAEIIRDPELRYTPDNQTPIAEMTVQFPGLRPEDPPATLKAIGWGNLAQEIQSNYHTGDRVVIEGRLNMNTIDRPEGFKEKRAEITVQRLHRLEGATLSSSVTVASAPRDPQPQPARSTGKSPSSPKVSSPVGSFDAGPLPDLNQDDIPF